jgi:hypothetical protein
MRRAWGCLTVLVVLAGCGDEAGVPGAGAGGEAGAGASAGGTGAGGGDGGRFVSPPLGWEVASCDFTYEQDFVYDTAPQSSSRSMPAEPEGLERLVHGSEAGPDVIAHAEPAPLTTHRLPGSLYADPPDDVVVPGYDDDMPLFDRGTDWATPERCYETPKGARMLSEAEAYDLYRAIAERTTGVPVSNAPEVRTVVGLRGAYPGTFRWHGNLPNRFNDTLVLLWTEQDGSKRVREFPVNTDTGAVNFGYHASSSLWPNRRYHHINGWHNTYNALRIDESNYPVRDDGNNNGHWDSDRNGWLPPTGDDDHDRTGTGHNIHTGEVDAPLGTAPVDNWSAGCQVIPGIANWMEFVARAWTGMGDPVSYHLIDARDVPQEIWTEGSADGSHAYPLLIDALPFSHSGDTSTVLAREMDTYSCDPDVDESGPEMVYVLPLDASGTLTVTVDCQAPVDVDVHLLMADAPTACLARDHTSLSYDVGPGRYWIVVDSFVDGGQEMSGEYSIVVTLE